MKPQDINKYWSGPVPYSISQRDSFLGRNDELEQFSKMIYESNLSLLTGASGVGKSSFLYAGVIPKIIDEYKEEGKLPIFLVKNWYSGISDEASVLEAIKNDIKENADDKESKEYLAHLDGDEKASIYTRLKETANNSVGWGILILDQFEEIIRSSTNKTNHVLNVISKLILNVKQISIVISFREEYFIAFKDLESVFGGISNHTLQLKPITKEKCKKEILKEICPKIKEELNINIGFSDQDLDKHRSDKNINSSNIKDIYDLILTDCIINKTGDSAQENQDEIDFLALQAVMEDLYKSAYNSRKTIDLSFYRTHNDEKIKEFGLSEDLDNTVKKSLYVWFDNAITKSIKTQKEKIPFLGKEIKPCVFYLFVEICPLLASKGYKENWDIDDLKDRLLSKYKNTESWFEGYIEKSDEDEKGLNKIFKEQNIFSNDLLRIFDQEILENRKSSINKDKIEKFTKNIKPEFLDMSFKIAINLLENAKILKKSQLFEQEICSIRHDKLGIVADLWANRNKSTFRYAESQFKTTGALDIIFNDAMLKNGLEDSNNNKNYLKFRATYFFNPQSKKKQSTNQLSSITFSDSIFTASVFENIHFLNCNFENCNLEGAVFIDCIFEDTIFQNCSFKGTMLKSRGLKNNSGNIIKNLFLDGCDVLVSEFNDLVLEGDLYITTDENKASTIKGMKKNRNRYIYDEETDTAREKEFSLSSIRLKKGFTPTGKIMFLNDIKSNNLMIDKTALTSASFESTNINGMSLLGG